MQESETGTSALGLKPPPLFKEKSPRLTSLQWSDRVPRAAAGTGILPAPAHLPGLGFYLAGVEAIDRFDQLPGLTSHLVPLLGRCEQQKRRGYHRRAHRHPPEMDPALPQSDAGVFKHMMALHEDYDNSYKVVRANVVYSPLSLGQYLSLYC